MRHPTRRWCAVLALLTLLMMAVLSGCQSSPNGTTNKATATSGPHATATSKPGGTPGATGTPPLGGTPSPTATPITACKGTLSDIDLPNGAVQVGKTITAGATTTCDYQVPQDVKTVDTFFTTQMPKSGWTLLHDDSEGPMAMVQQYFKAERFATISLSQHGSDTHSTDVTISVEASQ